MNRAPQTARSPRVRRIQWWLAGIALVLSLLVTGVRSVYTLGANQMAVLTQFGASVGPPVKKAGLHFKRPWQNVHLLDQRVRLLTFPARELRTSAREPLRVTPYACWRISAPDAMRYLAATAGEQNLQPRLRELVWEALDNALAEYTSADATRAPTAATKPAVAATNMILDGFGRRCRQAAARFGVTLVDVGLQRITRPAHLAETVGQSMQTQAHRFEAAAERVNRERAAAIKAAGRRRARAILEEHRRKANELESTARQKAARLRAEAYTLNAELARTVEQRAILRKLISPREAAHEMKARTAPSSQYAP